MKEETKVFISSMEVINIGYMDCKPFRKKPVIIFARQISEAFEVHTLEGIMKGNPGDWLIRGVKGEYYLRKDEIFKETYEEVK